MSVDLTENQEIDYTLTKINQVMDSINKDDNLTMINETDLLLKTLPEELKTKEVIKLEGDIKSIINDENKMRIIRLLKRIKEDPETAAEYYDVDIGRDHRLFYQIQHEKDMIILQERIRKIFSEIIKNKLGEIKL